MRSKLWADSTHLHTTHSFTNGLNFPCTCKCEQKKWFKSPTNTHKHLHGRVSWGKEPSCLGPLLATPRGQCGILKQKQGEDAPAGFPHILMSGFDKNLNIIIPLQVQEAKPLPAQPGKNQLLLTHKSKELQLTANGLERESTCSGFPWP